MFEVGLCKISYMLLVGADGGDEVVVSRTGFVDGMPEWKKMRNAYFEDPTAGYCGEFLVIPKGVTVVVLRLDNHSKTARPT